MRTTRWIPSIPLVRPPRLERHTGTAAVLLCLMLLSGCAMHSDRVFPVETEVRDQIVRVAALESSQDTFIIQVHIEDQGPFQFLLDTGAATSLIDTRVADAFPNGLSKVSNSFLVTGSERVPYDTVLRIDRLRVGDAHFKDFQATVFDLRSIGQALQTEIHGILGFPTFRDCLLTLDYERREVAIESGTLPESNGRDLLKLVGDARRPTIPITIEGQSVPAVVDTGFKGFLRLPKAAITHTEDEVWLGRSTTVAGVSSKAYVPLEEPALLGGFRLHFPRFAMAGVEEGSPLIGSHILRRFRWTFDQRSRVVQITPRGNEFPEATEARPATVLDAQVRK